jgi:preprotein translocase SecE subunit
MAMPVAENAPVTTERTPRSAQQSLALTSVVGAVYVLVGIWVVLAGIPLAWDLLIHDPSGKLYINEFLSGTLVIMLSGAAAVAIGYGGYQLLKNQHQPGARAGIFFAAVMIFLSLWISVALGNLSNEPGDTAVALTIAGVTLAVLLGGTGFLFLQPGWGRMLETVEEQGWFYGSSFKQNQGVRVRRGTILGVLILGGCGIITLVWHRSFGVETVDNPNNWIWYIPGTEHEYALPLMFRINFLMPCLLGLVLIYFAWRLVNVPVFADFLIATEAEMNKVSWTTRRRLIQDTIVVLVTVVLLTSFLFVVDIIWIWVLGNPFNLDPPFPGVLQYDPRKQQQKQVEKNQW